MASSMAAPAPATRRTAEELAEEIEYQKVMLASLDDPFVLERDASEMAQTIQEEIRRLEKQLKDATAYDSYIMASPVPNGTPDTFASVPGTPSRTSIDGSFSTSNKLQDAIGFDLPARKRPQREQEGYTSPEKSKSRRTDHETRFTRSGVPSDGSDSEDVVARQTSMFRKKQREAEERARQLREDEEMARMLQQEEEHPSRPGSVQRPAQPASQPTFSQPAGPSAFSRLMGPSLPAGAPTSSVRGAPSSTSYVPPNTSGYRDMPGAFTESEEDGSSDIEIISDRTIPRPPTVDPGSNGRILPWRSTAPNPAALEALQSGMGADLGAKMKDIVTSLSQPPYRYVPQPPQSAFAIFAEKYRVQLQSTHPHMQAGALNQYIGRKWSSLSQQQRAPYEAQAAQAVRQQMSSGSVNPAANAAAAAREAAIKREGDWRVGLPPPNAPSRPGLGNYNPHSNYLDLTTTPDYSFTNIFGNMASGVANTVNTAFNAASAMGRSLSDYDAAFQGRMDEVSDYIQDPRRTAQEIQDLLENIRPDTEIPKEDREGTPEGLKYALYEHQKLALTWLKQMEEGTNKGGILADDMGLGKTISALALILSKPSQDRARKTTLIVGPVALVRQWEREVQTKIKPSHSLSTFLYHGGKKKKWSELRTFDIVLTTYGTLGAEYKRWETWKGQCDLNRDLDPNAINSKLPLLGKESNWHRVILDEAQCIKNKLTKAASAVFHLKASTRFCLTGTPMMNGVHELYSLIKFLRIRPYNDYKRFNEDFGCLSKSVGRYGYNNKEYAMKRLQAVLKAILLRRTKSSQIDGKPILVLPPKTEEIVHAIFNEDEQAYYSGLEDRTRVQFNKYVKSGTIGKNYSNILVLLLRLRQAACHPHLIMDFEEAPAEATPEDMTNLAKTLTPEVVRRIIAATFPFECPVCYDSVLNPRIVIPCGHDTCSECLAKITGVSEQEAIARGDESGNGQAKCPTCRGKIDSKRLIDYETFKQVHMKDEKDKEVEGVDEDDDGESISDSDLDSDSDSDEDSETESEDEDERPGRNGDLRNFIVPDDEVTESEKEESDEEDDDLNIGTSSTQTKPAKKERKFKREVKDEDETDSDYVGLGSLNRQTRKTRLSGATNVANDDASETMSAKEEDTNDSDLVDIKDFKPLARRSRTASRSLIKAEEADGEDTEDTDIKPPKRSRQDSKLRRPAKKAKSSSAKGKGKDKKSSKKESRRGKKRSRGADDEEKKPEKHLSLAKLKAEAMRSKEGRKRYMRYLKKNWISSAKVDKCLEILRDTDPEVKTIVFSQFTTLLDLLEVPMKQEEWKFCRYDGSMTADQRHKSIMKFTDDPSVRLMIVSLKAGNAGLNLVAASQVIILDPFWNPYIEMQAVDRAHRIGQQKPVKVHRILVAKTVEDRIMELQGQKRKFVDAALDEKASQSLGRLGQRELIYLFNGDGVQGSGRETQARLPVSLGVPGMGAGGSGAAGPSGSMGMGMPPPSLGSGLGNGMGSGASSRGLGGSSVYGP